MLSYTSSFFFFLKSPKTFNSMYPVHYVYCFLNVTLVSNIAVSLLDLTLTGIHE